MITPSHIENFSEKLMSILADELSHNNEVVETSSGWPDKETIMVFLRKPFFKTYTVSGIEFRELNDPHWWKAEYYDQNLKHILACKFG